MASGLKAKYEELERNEPWQGRENNILPRDKVFIRGIQVIYKVDKQKAIEIYEKHNLESKKSFTRLKKNVIKGIKDAYPKHKVFTTKSGKHKPPKIKTKTQKKRQLTTKKTKKGEKEKLRKYTPKTASRVVHASNKYPDASNYELRHGVNSKASQNYRERHGMKREYTGRIIINEKR